MWGPLQRSWVTGGVLLREDRADIQGFGDPGGGLSREVPVDDLVNDVDAFRHEASGLDGQILAVVQEADWGCVFSGDQFGFECVDFFGSEDIGQLWAGGPGHILSAHGVLRSVWC